MDVCDRLKKIMLRANNISGRTAAVKGLLYLLQAPLLGNENDSNHIRGIFLPVALEIIQEFKSDR